MSRGLAVIAACAGAMGVALLALGAHHPAGANLSTAGQMLLFHAPLILLLALNADTPRLAAVPRRLAALLLSLGLALFSGDLVLRALAGFRLFPFAAPLGGGMLIAGWLALAVAALPGRKNPPPGD